MTPEDREEYKFGILTILMVLTIIALVLFTSCASPTKVATPTAEPVIEYRDKVVYRERVDSVVVRDSVYIEKVIKGDTIKETEYRYKYIDRLVERVDTFLKVDSVPKPYPVIETITTNELTFWQRLEVGFGKICILITFLAVIYLALKQYIRR